MVTIDLSNVNFQVDPMMEHKIQMQIQSNPRFAQIINLNITSKIYGYFNYKVRMRENLNIAIKGETRSGKTTVGLSWGVYISCITRMPYTVYHICANESEYYAKVKQAKFNELYHVDEQKEAKFGSGSFREEMGIMDIQNIIAKRCIHTIWIYPTDFIARNSIYGFETYGKDLKNKLIRCIVYDLRKSVLGVMQPLGYVIVPKYQDPNYQKIPEDQWSEYRYKNSHDLGRPDFDSLIEEHYEQKKDEWIIKEQKREVGYHHEERFKLGIWLRTRPEFMEAGNKKKQRIIARQLFRDLTEQEIDEVVEVARMEIGLEELGKLRDEHVDEGGREDEKDEERGQEFIDSRE